MGTSNNVNVSAANTSVGLVSSLPTSNFGQTVTFTATVSATFPSTAAIKSGTVTFFDNGSPMGSPVTLVNTNVASFSTSTLSKAVHSITATYTDAAGNFNTSTSPPSVRPCSAPPR